MTITPRPPPTRTDAIFQMRECFNFLTETSPSTANLFQETIHEIIKEFELILFLEKWVSFRAHHEQVPLDCHIRIIYLVQSYADSTAHPIKILHQQNALLQTEDNLSSLHQLLSLSHSGVYFHHQSFVHYYLRCFLTRSRWTR